MTSPKPKSAPTASVNPAAARLLETAEPTAVTPRKTVESATDRSPETVEPATATPPETGAAPATPVAPADNARSRPPHKSAHKAPPKRLHFTEKNIETLCCDAGQVSTTYWDTAKPGFGLRINAGGARTFIVSGRIKGSNLQRQATIGRPSEALSLKKARERGATLLQEMRDGKDARADAEAQKAQQLEPASTVTLQEIYEKFKLTNSKRGVLRRAVTLKGYEYTLRHYLSDIKDLPIRKINKMMCRDIFNRISKTGKIAANLVMRQLHALLEHAREIYLDDDTGLYVILPVNPVARMRKIAHPNVCRPRKRRLELTHTRRVYRFLKERGRTEERAINRTSADCARFLMISGKRGSEAYQLRHSYMDFENDRIVIPLEASKTEDDLVFPMNAPMRELLLHRLALHQENYPGQTAPDDWVFPSSLSASGHITSCGKMLQRAARACRVKFSKHDLRRTFVDVANELGIDSDVCRRLLNHKAKDVHGDAYDNNPAALIEPMKRIGEWFELAEEDPEPAPLPIPRAPLEEAAAQRRRQWLALDATELTKLVWEIPIVQVAQRFGLSDRAVGRRCKRLGVSTPRRGYWAMTKAHRTRMNASGNPPVSKVMESVRPR